MAVLVEGSGCGGWERKKKRENRVATPNGEMSK